MIDAQAERGSEYWTRRLRRRSLIGAGLAGGAPVPGLAVSAESPDAITWTLKLRTDVKWQNVAPVNGHPFEAEDVKASWTRALTIKGNPFAGAIDMLDPTQITTPAKDTVI